MSEKTKQRVLSICALVVFIGFCIGMGFVWDSFWKVDATTSAIYWVSKCIILALVAVFVSFIVFAKTDKGIGAMQVVFSVIMCILPIVLRVLCMIPYAGKYIAVILTLILTAIYLLTMLSLGSYGKGEGNKKI